MLSFLKNEPTLIVIQFYVGVHTIAGLIVDLRGNGLFHRELAVGAKIDPYGRGHLQRRGGSRGWNGRWSGWWRPRPSSGFRLISLLKEVAVVWNIIGV